MSAVPLKTVPDQTLAQWLREYADQIERGEFTDNDAVIIFHDEPTARLFRVRRRAFKMNAIAQLGAMQIATKELLEG